MARGPAERRYATVQVRFYTDEKVQALSAPQPNAQTLMLRYLSGPETSRIPGVLFIGRAAMSEALGWPVEAFDRCHDELQAAKIVVADWKARVVYLVNALRQDCNRPASPSTATCWRRELLNGAECELTRRIDGDLRVLMAEMGPTFLASYESGRRNDGEQGRRQSAPQGAAQVVDLPAGRLPAGSATDCWHPSPSPSPSPAPALAPVPKGESTGALAPPPPPPQGTGRGTEKFSTVGKAARAPSLISQEGLGGPGAILAAVAPSPTGHERAEDPGATPVAVALRLVEEERPTAVATVSELGKPSSPAQRKRVDAHHCAAQQVLDALNAARSRLRPSSHGIRATYSSLDGIASRLDAGRTVEECLHVIAVYEAEVTTNSAAMRYFDAVSPWRPENFERASAADPSIPIAADPMTKRSTDPTRGVAPVGTFGKGK